MTKVLVSIPTAPSHPYIHKHVCFVTDRLINDSRYRVILMRPTWNPYENNLHHIVRDFLASDCEFWLNIDSDNPPINNPLDLVELDKDIIGLPTPVWHCTGDEKPGERPYYWNVYDFVSDEAGYKEHEPKSGLQRVDAVGTGCLLIARHVFLNPAMSGSFTRTLYPDGCVEKGNDLAFCERARKNGFEIYAHYNYPCRHFINLELTEVIRAFENLYRGVAE